jgi:formate dehydrogenase major subunit
VAQFGKAEQYPYVATTYRTMEHFHSWTKNFVGNSIIAPRQYVEIGEELAAEKGLKTGDTVKISSPRGEVICAVEVTKRIKTLTCDGKKVHTVGMPIHWGVVGVAKPAYMTNYLSPVVADANTQTPEYKAFLVNLVKA